MKELSVLVVEDSIPMLEIMVTILDRFGFGRIFTAEDGEQAFSIYQRYKPDLIITDWHMEGVNGLELTEWIRRNKYSVNRTIPIILMTGFSEQIRIANARDVGVTEVIVKPFTAEALARRIMHVIDAPRDFIESNSFFGPDRRRRPDDGFSGDVDRRKVNPDVAGGH